MPVESAADIASMFEEDEFAEAASYQSPVPGTDPVPCLVILDRGQGRTRFRAGDVEGTGTNRHLWAQAGDEENQLPDVRRDGLFTIDADGEVLQVQGMPELDHQGHLWSVQLVVMD
jgi:hypothetical protein